MQFLHVRHLAEHHKQDAKALAVLRPLISHTSHPRHDRVRALHLAL
ncbi:MAG TPA: hypothetical protein VNF46_07770 [Gammaproteobacteria bacterium]|nr:hypothetical protein [Gammaproteobacteria bacterium]